MNFIVYYYFSFSFHIILNTCIDMLRYHMTMQEVIF